MKLKKTKECFMLSPIIIFKLYHDGCWSGRICWFSEIIPILSSFNKNKSAFPH